MHKKGKQQLQKNHPNSIPSLIYKLIVKIITKKLTNKLDSHQPREQASFHHGYGTNDDHQVVLLSLKNSCGPQKAFYCTDQQKYCWLLLIVE